MRNAEKVDGKIDSIEEQLARMEEDNRFAQSLLDNLINDEDQSEKPKRVEQAGISSICL